MFNVRAASPAAAALTSLQPQRWRESAAVQGSGPSSDSVKAHLLILLSAAPLMPAGNEGLWKVTVKILQDVQIFI